MADLPLDHGPRLPGDADRAAGALQDLRRAGDGREGIAELMPEHGQEIVRGTVGPGFGHVFATSYAMCFLRASMKPDSGRARQASFHRLRPRATTRDGSFRRISAAPDAAVLRGGSRDAGLVRDGALNARPPPEFQVVNSCGYVDNRRICSEALTVKTPLVTLRP